MRAASSRSKKAPCSRISHPSRSSARAKSATTPATWDRPARRRISGHRGCAAERSRRGSPRGRANVYREHRDLSGFRRASAGRRACGSRLRNQHLRLGAKLGRGPNKLHGLDRRDAKLRRLSRGRTGPHGHWADCSANRLVCSGADHGRPDGRCFGGVVHLHCRSADHRRGFGCCLATWRRFLACERRLVACLHRSDAKMYWVF